MFAGSSPALERAAALLGAALPGETLLDDATRRLAHRAITVERHGADALRLVAVSAAAAAAGLDRPLVGREAELRRLRELLDAVIADREPRLAAVVGPPGIGKSRLVADLVAPLADDVVVLSTRRLPYGDGLAFLPLVELLLRRGRSPPCR